jgi:hypothetical protein
MPGISERPECACHGEVMLWNKDTRYAVEGYWKCRVRHRERMQKRYDALTGLEYNALLLRHRRAKAMTRRAKRVAARG